MTSRQFFFSMMPTARLELSVRAEPASQFDVRDSVAGSGSSLLDRGVVERFERAALFQEAAF